MRRQQLIRFLLAIAYTLLLFWLSFRTVDSQKGLIDSLINELGINPQDFSTLISFGIIFGVIFNVALSFSILKVIATLNNSPFNTYTIYVSIIVSDCIQSLVRIITNVTAINTRPISAYFLGVYPFILTTIIAYLLSRKEIKKSHDVLKTSIIYILIGCVLSLGSLIPINLT